MDNYFVQPGVRTVVARLKTTNQNQFQACMEFRLLPSCSTMETINTSLLFMYIRTPEIREKISKSLKEFFYKNPDALKHLSKVHSGKKASLEARKKMSEARKGRIMTSTNNR